VRPLPRSCQPIAWVTWRQAGVPAEGRHGMEGAGWLAEAAPRRYTVRRGSGRRQAAHLSLFLMAVARSFVAVYPGDLMAADSCRHLGGRVPDEIYRGDLVYEYARANGSTDNFGTKPWVGHPGRRACVPTMPTASTPVGEGLIGLCVRWRASALTQEWPGLGPHVPVSSHPWREAVERGPSTRPGASGCGSPL
jgi:hypothetical protein